VRIWQDKHELLPGDDLDRPLLGPRGAVSKSGRVRPVCSANSLDPRNLAWVDCEVSEALAIERQHLQDTGEHLQMIIPPRRLSLQ